MGVAIRVGRTTFEVGSPAFLKSFFSTVYLRLEHATWGSRFPTVMNILYAGEVGPGHAAAALEELRTIQAEFGTIPPDRVVWDFENSAQAPPWGGHIAPSIRNLADCFVTSSGRPLLAVLSDAFEIAAREVLAVRIR